MNIFTRIEDSITRFFMWLHHEDPGKHGQPASTTNPEDPQSMAEPPVYKRMPVTNEEMDIVGYVDQLVCPVCGSAVKRTDSYCRECGDHLMEAE